MMNRLRNVGDYDRRFRIESPVEVKQVVGNAVKTEWQILTTVWGKFMPQPGKEQIEAQQQVEKDNVKIETRFWAGVDAKCQIIDVIYGGTYQIQNVIPVKREDYLLITAVKRDNQ